MAGPQETEEKAAADLPIGPVERRGHADQMVAAIMSLIEQGILREGDLLPPERELAQRFEVGRNTLREAIKVLEIFGVVDRAPRLGTVIRRANLDSILAIAFAGLKITPEVFEDIQGFRRLIELGVATAVVERATEADWNALERLITRMEQTTDIREQARWDFEFHFALVDRVENAVIARTYRIMAEPMKRLMELGKSHGIEGTARDHRAMVDALRARDADAYTARLDAHLSFARRYLASGDASAPSSPPSAPW
jgi:DNA-binding FadR family transcriptional regulator